MVVAADLGGGVDAEVPFRFLTNNSQRGRHGVAAGANKISSPRRRSTCGVVAEATMNDISRVLQSMDQGDPRAAAALLPLVYEELRKLAAQKLAVDSDYRLCDVSQFVRSARPTVGSCSPGRSRPSMMQARTWS